MNYKNFIPMTSMLFNKRVMKNLFEIHKCFKANPQYKFRYLFRASWNMTKHERIIKHNGSYIINSFLPPLNSEAFMSTMKNVQGEGADFYTSHVEGKNLAPVSTSIAVTKKCMYNCWHCHASKMMKQEQKDLTATQLIKIIKDLQKFGVGIISFTGGEPLIRNDLEEIISEIDDRSITIIFSSGFGLTKERAIKLKKSGLFGIAISFDSVIPEVHDTKRGYKGAYQIALDAIHHAKNAKLYTIGQVTCTRELLQTGEIHDIAEFLKKQNIDELRILDPIPSGNLENQPNEVLTQKEKEELVKLHHLFNSKKKYPKTSVVSYVESEDQFGCVAGFKHSYIDYEGNLTACDFMDKSYGNLINEPMEKVFKKMRDACGGPKCGCFAKKQAGCANVNEVKIPKYYRLLGGKTE